MLNKSLLLCLFVLGAVTAATLLPFNLGTTVSGQKSEEVQKETQPRFPNFDIRETKNYESLEFFAAARSAQHKTASKVADIREDFARGESDLQARVPHVKFEYNTDLRIPEVITPDVWQERIEPLSEPSGLKRSEILRNFIRENNRLIGVTDTQATTLKVTADYTNPNGITSFAHLEQEINGIPVFRGEVKAGFNQDGQIIRVINNLAPGLDYAVVSNDFGDPADAVAAAANSIEHQFKPGELNKNGQESKGTKVVFGSGDMATTAEKMYFPTEPGVAIPSWRVLIWQPVDAYYVIVDAKTGTVLWRKNITDHQSQTATYQIYGNPTAYTDMADSPAPLSPYTGGSPGAATQGAAISRTNRTLIGNEGALSFNQNGWITDGLNETAGNNTIAGVDRDTTNGIDATIVGSPPRVFDSTWNPPPAGTDDPLSAQAQRGAVIQMFYVMNRYHDELYKLGFNEAARNFQLVNFTGQGSGNDRVLSEGQDNTGGTSACPTAPCFNNANFSTPGDGSSGRMQMYLWSGPTPDRDGTADADIIIHEVTHGTSNRLHGNGSGLGNQGGMMGEGWGDWYGTTMLAEPGDGVDGIYGMGGYSLFQLGGFTSNYYHGIRRFPTANINVVGGPQNKPHNPLTFGHLNAGCDTTLGTTSTAVASAFPRNPVVATGGNCSQVHNAGEIWKSALWEVRGLMVTRLGFQTGTQRVLQLVTDGMKLAPISPMMLQERDAIIAAAAAQPGGGGLDIADIREGFRRRGMGFSASTQSSTAVTEAFDFANAAIVPPITLTDPGPGGDGDGVPEPGETIQLSVPVQNTSGASISNVVVTATGGGNANYGTIANGQTVVQTISYPIAAGAACGSSVTIVLNLTSSAGTQTPVNYVITLGTAVVSNTETFDASTPPTLPAGWTNTQLNGNLINWVTSATGPSSGPNSGFANNATNTSSAAMTSPAFAISSASAKLRFRLNFATEDAWDGAVLEMKVGAGAFQDILTAGGTFTSGGYNGTINGGTNPNPLNGRSAWTGTSGGYVTTLVNLPASANGQSVQFRWIMGTDSSQAVLGIFVDTVEIINGFTCGGGPGPTPTPTPTPVPPTPTPTPVPPTPTPTPVPPTPTPTPVPPTPTPTPVPPTPTPTPNPGVCTPTLTVTEVFPGSLNAFTSITAGPNAVTVDIADSGIGLQGYTVVSATNANVSIPSFPTGTFNPVTASFTIPSPGQPVDFTLRASSRVNAILIRAQCAGGPAPTPTPVPPTPTPVPPTPTPTPVPPTPTPTPVPPTPTPTPGPGTCTPTLTVTEVFPGSAAAFEAITPGSGSVTVDLVNAGIGLQGLTLVNASNANVTIPSFTFGTTSPVTVTFTRPNAGQAVDFTLRASARANAVLIRAQCSAGALSEPVAGLSESGSIWSPRRSLVDGLMSVMFYGLGTTEPKETARS